MLIMWYEIIKAFQGDKLYEVGERIEVDELSPNWRNLQVLINCGYMRPVNLVQV